MREIKFRAWIYPERRITDVIGLCYEPDGRIGVEVVKSGRDWTGDKNDCEFWWKGSEAIILEYTGLKDKNGKEIYEGDIVRFWFVGDEFIRLVEWSVPQAGFVAGFSVDLGKVNGTSAVEVIGNIYENPELIR